jgi:threonylcarbamoyladenosine tRNA methylthiotransferase MtaB
LLVTGEKARLLELPSFLGTALNGERPQAGRLGELVSRWLQDCASKQVSGKEQPASFQSGSFEPSSFEPSSFEPSSFEPDAFRFTPQKFSFHTRAFIKIQDGCDKHCAYCRIRLARGPSRSMAAKNVLEELQALEAGGYWEAVLTGVNIGQYRDPGGTGNLDGLLAYLLEGTRSIGLRLSSLEPEGIDEGLAAVLSHPRIRPHFHLSVQSGSEAVLEKMGRSYSGETVERAAALLRSVRGKPFLACDIIAGFPGETEDDFNQTLSLCRKIEFAWIHAFPYSKRPGTPAFSYPQTVSERETGRRVGLLTDLAWQGRSNYQRGCVGMEVEALVEKYEKKDGYCRGLADNYLKLLIKPSGPGSPDPGAVLRCRIRSPALYSGEEEAGYDAKADEIL